MTDAECLARLQLIRTDGIGPAGFRHLLRRFGSAVAAADALPDLAGRGGVAMQLADRSAMLAEIDAVAALGATHLHACDPAYPALMRQLPDAPPVLVALGDVALAARPTVAIVGARNASAAGRAMARDLAADLGAAGMVSVSGMARGIDGAAHLGALPHGTIACVAGGIDVVYPPEHAELQRRVAEQGLLLSEAAPGTQPTARHFPRRNRLIVGASQGVVVIEAAEGSGSLITARIAGDIGREVMAVPGHPADPRSKGGNRLLRDGAALVETALDVLAVLQPMGADAALRERAIRLDGAIAEPPSARAQADADARFHELLGPAPVAVEELIRQSGLETALVVSMLADLELAGTITRHAGGRVSLA